MTTEFESTQEFINVLNYENALTYNDLPSKITLTQEDKGDYVKEAKGLVGDITEILYISDTQSIIVKCIETNNELEIKGFDVF